MTVGAHIRPALAPSLSEAEFTNWYWLRAELQDFARQLDVSAGGSKDTLTRRIAARLAGRSVVEAPARIGPRGLQLTGKLSRASVIPPGQRCSQHLRAWFTAEIGTGFRFDAAMRGFIASAAGRQTLGDALQHWHRTRAGSPLPIDSQFEFNRFTRSWHAAHPGEDRDALLDAWERYRSTPIALRGRI